MFEKFSAPARQVVVLAQDEARTLRHGYIGGEHFLIGLLREEKGLAASVLRSFDVTLDRLRGEVVRIVGVGDGVPRETISFSPDGKRVLERTLREAMDLGYNYVGPGHLLLGVVREVLSSLGQQGVAAQVLERLNVPGENIRDRVKLILLGHD